jgi:Tfp pilus assembly ATPase PilU
MDEAPDLNRLIRELNAEGREDALGEDSTRLNRWLETLLERRGSDLLLVAGSPPCVRVDGAVLPLREPPLSGEEIEEAVLPALPGSARSRYA